MISALVAFRDPSGERARQWDFVRSRLADELPDVEIVVSSDDGGEPFSKGMALNHAASRASGDVFYILDADTYVAGEQVRRALAGLRHDPSRWWRPWRLKLKLGPEATERVLSGWDGVYPTQRRELEAPPNRHFAAPPLLVHRDLYSAAGGMPEFRGWGFEDNAFAYALQALSGPHRHVEGMALHLYHPRLGKPGRDLWLGQTERNAHRAIEYQRARDIERMNALVDGRLT